MKVVVPNYGLHKDVDGITWLLQNDTAHNIVGLPVALCPFEVKSKGVECPHNFNIFGTTPVDPTLLRRFSKLMEAYPLLRAMVPGQTPKKCLYVVSTAYDDLNYLNKLQLISNPVGIRTGQGSPVEQVRKKTDSSNLGNYIMSGLTLPQWPSIMKVIQDSINMRSQLILVGERMPFPAMPDILRVTQFPQELKEFLSTLKSDDDLRSLGNFYLRRHLITMYEGPSDD